MGTIMSALVSCESFYLIIANLINGKLKFFLSTNNKFPESHRKNRTKISFIEQI